MNSKLFSLVVVALFCAANFIVAFAAPQSQGETFMTANSFYTFEQYFQDAYSKSVRVSSTSISPTMSRVTVAFTHRTDTIEAHFDFKQKVEVAGTSYALIYAKIGTTYPLTVSSSDPQAKYFKDVKLSIKQADVQASGGDTKYKIYKVLGELSFEYNGFAVMPYTKAFEQRFVLRQAKI